MKNQHRVQTRIRTSVTEDEETGCWIWGRQISNTGYGRLTLSREGGTYMESAHRASYMAFIGPIPKNGIIRQSCGNRLCVYPGHLKVSIEKQ